MDPIFSRFKKFRSNLLKREETLTSTFTFRQQQQLYLPRPSFIVLKEVSFHRVVGTALICISLKQCPHKQKLVFMERFCFRWTDKILTNKQIRFLALIFNDDAITWSMDHCNSRTMITQGKRQKILAGTVSSKQHLYAISIGLEQQRPALGDKLRPIQMYQQGQ